MELSKSFGYSLRVLTLREYKKIDYYSVKNICDMHAVHVDITKYVTMKGIRKMFVDIVNRVFLLPVCNMFRKFSLPHC